MRVILGLLAFVTLAGAVFFAIDGFTIYMNAENALHQIMGLIDFVIVSILWGTWIVCGFISINKEK